MVDLKEKITVYEKKIKLLRSRCHQDEFFISYGGENLFILEPYAVNMIAEHYENKLNDLKKELVWENDYMKWKYSFSP